MVSKPFVCENYETAEDDKAGDNDVEDCPWVPNTLASLKLPRTAVSLS